MKKIKILVPVDFRAANAPALRVAVDMASALNARLILLHVVGPSRRSRGVSPYVLAREEMWEEVHRQLEQYRPLIPSSGKHAVSWEREVRFGSIAETIVASASENRVRFIVLATHGREGLARMVIGSVTDFLVRHAPCPVVCIPPHCDGQS